MIIIFETHAIETQIKAVESKVRELGLDVHRSDGVDHTVLGVVGDRSGVDQITFSVMPGVREVVSVSSPYKLASREFHPDDTVVHVGDVPVGGTEVILMAGPCAVESSEQIESTARFAASTGVKILRGGTFKPRTSPYSFQGLGEEGLAMLRRAAEKHNLASVTEVMTIEQIEVVSRYADLLQVGARNMQNCPLLTEIGKVEKPVLLKRGQSATIKDLLLSAEYIRSAGNPNCQLH